MTRRGAKVVGRNVRCPPGEVDLVVEFDGRLVAVEVRTRRDADPILEITDDKMESVARSARRIGAKRVDLVTVRFDQLGPVVRWIPGC